MMPLKILEIEDTAILQLDLEIIQAMVILESLVFLNCNVQNGLRIFPPKLKVLQIIPSSEGGVFVNEGLSESLESFECDYVNLKRSMESGFLIPPKLLNLDVTRLKDSERNDEIEIFPFDLPETLLSLKILDMTCLSFRHFHL
jgi:hypothetical protein